ncbi:MAG: DUF2490 domain-containing protein [Pseudohongiellaceae bacterium]
MAKTNPAPLINLAAFILLCFTAGQTTAQIDEDQLGIWTAYTWNTQFNESRWGLRGDIQLRNWDIYRDTEQYLARAGFTYTPTTNRLSYQLGIASVTSTEFGPGNSSNTENRIFQDVTFRHRSGERTNFQHRFRAEQRWIENQRFRTRYRYAVTATTSINRKELVEDTWYVAMSNELFLNGETAIGKGRQVDFFDRNRSAIALGYLVNSDLRIQFGYMHQWTDNLDKGQMQVRLSQRF